MRAKRNIAKAGSGKKIRPSGRNVTPEQVTAFLEELAESCNVRLAAETAGFHFTWAYRERRTNAAFRRSWARAVSEGYAKLELMLLERAMVGTPKEVTGRGGESRTIVEYSTPLAIALLKRHAALADEAELEMSEEELRETRERILAKLDLLGERLRSEKAPDEGR